MSEAQLDIAMQEIYFCRYLSIAPTDFDMGAKVLELLEAFQQLLNSKNTNDELKLSLLATLKYLVGTLCFYEEPHGTQRGAMQI